MSAELSVSPGMELTRMIPEEIQGATISGMSAELSLVQDGANTVNPEKIQGATMPYG